MTRRCKMELAGRKYIQLFMAFLFRSNGNMSQQNEPVIFNFLPQMGVFVS